MLYKKIEAAIETKISNKQIQSGEKLPSIRVLAQTYSCSKNTVIKAMSELEKKHLVYAVPKQGFFVAVSNEEILEISTVIDFLSAEPEITTINLENFYHCSEQIMAQVKDKLLPYGNPSGVERLKEQLIPYLQNNQVFTSTNRLMITTGSQQAIDLLMNMPFPNKRKKILVEQPTYFGALISAKLSENDVLGISVEGQKIDLEQLEYIFKNNEIKLFYTIPRFHNPLGHSYSNETKKAIVDLADKYDVYILEDDYLGDLELDTKRDPMYSYNPNGRVIYMKSFSKIFLPGLRLGMVVLPEPFISTFLEFKFSRDFSTPVFSQEILATYLENGMFANHLKQSQQIYASKMKHVKSYCHKYLPPNVLLEIPDTGYYFSLKLPDNLYSHELVAALKLKNVLVDDTSRMFLPNSKSKEYIRLSISKINSKDLEFGIQQIAETIAELGQRKYSIFKEDHFYM